jgi:hypothetical protein
MFVVGLLGAILEANPDYAKLDGLLVGAGIRYLHHVPQLLPTVVRMNPRPSL